MKAHLLRMNRGIDGEKSGQLNTRIFLLTFRPLQDTSTANGEEHKPDLAFLTKYAHLLYDARIRL